jgi:hypothetical protein
MMDHNHFQFEHSGVTLTVEKLNVPKQMVFRVSFSSKRASIVIARAVNADNTVFWTSIPEGRQPEAEGVGKLIEEYLIAKQ